jgi:hypothetical protein
MGFGFIACCRAKGLREPCRRSGLNCDLTTPAAGQNRQDRRRSPGLVGHRHSAFRQQVLDVTQAEGEPEVEPYRLVNDLGREPVSGVADFLHLLGYSATGRTARPTRRDNAVPKPASHGKEARRRESSRL